MHTEDQSTWQLALHTEGNCVGSWQMCGLGVFMLAHTVGMLSTWFVQFWQTIRCNATEHSIVYSQELTILFAPIVRFTLNAGTPFWSIHLNQCRLFQRFIHIRTTYSSISSHFIIFSYRQRFIFDVSSSTCCTLIQKLVSFFPLILHS